mgnify:CR=1 FL=1
MLLTLSVKFLISEDDGLEEKLFPSSQVPPVVIFFKSLSLSPIDEDDDVQKGITVLLVKSLFLTKAFIGHAARPHRIG